MGFRPPPLLLLRSVTRFYRSFFSPVFLGRENLTVGRGKPRRPTLFVSNHTLLAFDFPLLLSWLYACRARHRGLSLSLLV